MKASVLTTLRVIVWSEWTPVIIIAAFMLKGMYENHLRETVAPADLSLSAEEERVAALVMPSVVFVRVDCGDKGRYGSTGVVIAPDTVLATAHQVRQGCDITVQQTEWVGSSPQAESGHRYRLVGEKLPMAVEKVRPDIDLAVIRTVESTAALARPIQLSEASPFLSVIYKVGQKTDVTSGVVVAPFGLFMNGKSLAFNGYTTTLPVNRGDSGSPVTDAQGRLLGIVWSLGNASSGMTTPGNIRDILDDEPATF